MIWDMIGSRLDPKPRGDEKTFCWSQKWRHKMMLPFYDTVVLMKLERNVSIRVAEQTDGAPVTAMASFCRCPLKLIFDHWGVWWLRFGQGVPWLCSSFEKIRLFLYRFSAFLFQGPCFGRPAFQSDVHFQRVKHESGKGTGTRIVCTHGYIAKKSTNLLIYGTVVFQGPMWSPMPHDCGAPNREDNGPSSAQPA